MRVTTTLLFFLFFFTSSKAQYNKGAKLVGGTLRFTSSKNYNASAASDRSSSFGISPSAGVFYQKNRLAGLSLYFGSNKDGDLPNGHDFGGGVFLRQYFQLAKSAFSFFAHESANVTVGRNSRYSSSITDAYRIKSTIANVAFAPAFAYGPTKRLQVEVQLPELLSLHYERHKPVFTSSANAYNYSQFGFQTGFQNFSSFTVGLSLLL